MEFLTKEQILENGKKFLKSQVVEIFGGKIKVIGLMSDAKEIFEKSIFDTNTMSLKQNLNNFRARLVALTVVHPETNERIFTDEDIKKLGKLPALEVDRIFVISQNLSGMGKEDVEGLTKNSKGQSDGDSSK